MEYGQEEDGAGKIVIASLWHLPAGSLVQSRGSLVNDPASPDKVLVIIPIVHIADHHAGYAGMDKFIVPQVYSYMRDSSAFAQRVKKDQVALLQFVTPDPPGRFVLFFRGAGKGGYSVYGGHEQEGKGRAVDPFAGSTAIMVRGAVPVFHKTQ